MTALLTGYHDRTADWSAQLREIEAKFAKSLSGPYRDAVFFELLSLRNLIALADFEAAAPARPSTRPAAPLTRATGNWPASCWTSSASTARPEHSAMAQRWISIGGPALA